MIIRETQYQKIPMELLLNADPSEENILQYLSESRFFAAIEDEETLGACAILNQQRTGHKNSVIELMNIAVYALHQGKGIGTALLQHAITVARTLKAEKMTVGTGTFGYQLAFYQKLGFRVQSIERDYFISHYSQAIYESGIQHQDRLILELTL